MFELYRKDKRFLIIGLIVSFLLFIGGFVLNLKDLKTYEGKVVANCVYRTRCTYEVQGVDYVYEANYYTDVQPKEPMTRTLRYNKEDPSKSHLTGITLGQAFLFLAIEGFLLCFVYCFYRKVFINFSCGFLVIFISELFYAPLIGSLNPIWYFKVFQLYGISTLIPFFFLLMGIIIMAIPFIEKLRWKCYVSPSNKDLKKEKIKVEETEEERRLRMEKEEKFNKIWDKIFDVFFFVFAFGETFIPGVVFFYEMYILFMSEDQAISSMLDIILFGIFMVPLFFIFLIKLLDFIVLCLSKKITANTMELLNKFKKVLLFLLVNEALLFILCLIVMGCKDAGWGMILFASITFILPIGTALIYNTYKFILDMRNISHSLIKFDVEKLMDILQIVFLSLFLGFGILTAFAGMIKEIQEGNYALLIFDAVWFIVLSFVLYFSLKGSLKKKQ